MKHLKFWLVKTLRKWSDEYNHNDSINYRIRKEDAPQSSLSNQSDSSMNLTVYHAIGGYVVECRTYDQKRDEYIRNMYIIGDDLEMGPEISKIISIEFLRR